MSIPTDYTDSQLYSACNVVRNCEIGFGDNWRCDFCEPNCNCDDIRKQNAIEQIMEILNVSYQEADNFYDLYS